MNCKFTSKISQNNNISDYYIDKDRVCLKDSIGWTCNVLIYNKLDKKYLTNTVMSLKPQFLDKNLNKLKLKSSLEI